MKTTLVIAFVLLVLVLIGCLMCAIRLAGLISQDEEQNDNN